MNELITHTAQLPDTIEDLSKFVLVNEERIQALRAQIRAIRKVNLAREVYEQKLAEAQEVGQVTVEAGQKMGELLLQIQKQTGNQYTSASPTNAEKRTKGEITADMGMTSQQVSQYQQMAQNPEAVQAAIQKAIENGDVVSRAQVMREIKSAKEAARQEAQAEIDRLRNDNRTLANRAKPETKIVEVEPEDYQQMKSKAKSYDSEVARLNNKINQVYEEKRKLQDQIDDLKQVTQEGLETGNLSENVFYFCTLANNFVGNAGGLVWLTSRINDMPDRERELFLKAAQALRDFSQVFTQNMERMEYGESDAVISGRELPSFPD